MKLTCGSRSLDLSMPVVMGIVNVTPDSFSDGGRWLDPRLAIEHALQLIDEGAGIIDVGGESTRPGAADVSADEELRRVLPVIEALAGKIQVPISIDTSRPEVIRSACAAGATLINDVRGLREPEALAAAASTTAAVCVMHMQGQPRTMQATPEYEDVVADVRQFLAERIDACEKAGIERERIVIDPGIGFGKRVEHNLRILARLRDFVDLAVPILIGVSRKSTVGVVTGRGVGDRLAGSVAFATAAALSGASIIRAHDVAATVDAVKTAVALRSAGYQI